MIKLATMILLPGAIAAAPIVVARLASLFCDKCNDDNWLREGGGKCAHGAWLWSLTFTLPAAIIVFLLLLFFMPWI